MAAVPSSDSGQEPLSALLIRLRQELATETTGSITIDRLMKSFGVRGFAFLLFLLPLLNLVLFMVPGLSFLFGIPMVVFATQMFLGYRRPFFPAFLRHSTIHCATLDRGLERGLGILRFVEPYICPRFPIASGPCADRVHSLLAVVLSCMVALPVPFLNIPPSLGAVALALGLIQRDGLFIVGGYGLAIWSLWLYRSFGMMAHFLL